MSTSGTERQFSPFLGDGLAQSFGLVPLVAAGVFDLTPGMYDGIRAQLVARARPRPIATVTAPIAAVIVTATFPIANLVVIASPPATARRLGPLSATTWFASIAATFPIADLVVTATPIAPTRGLGPMSAATWFPPSAAAGSVTFPIADLVVAATPSLPPRGLGPLSAMTWVAPSAAIPVIFPIADLVISAPVPVAPPWRYLLARTITPISMPPAPPASGTAAPLLAAAAFIAGRQSLRYQTDVLQAWNGLESRIALQPVPLERIQYTTLLTDAELAQVRAQLFAAPATPILVPIRGEDTIALLDVTTNAIAIDATLLDWGVAGDMLLVENAVAQAYVVTVASVAGAGITTVLTVDVGPPTGQVYAAGVARIALLRPAYLADGLGAARWPVAAGMFEISAVVQPPRVTFGTGVAVTTFDGLAVFDRRLNANSPTREATSAALETVEAAGGALITRTSLAQMRIRRGCRYVIRNANARQWLRAFLAAARGRQVAWLLPTWKPDLVLYSQPLPAATSLRTVNVPNYVTQWFPSLAHRHLQLTFADGTTTYLTVSAAVDNGDGTQTLTTTTVGAMTSPIAVISLLERVRFDQDEFVIVSQAGAIGVVDFEALVVQR